MKSKKCKAIAITWMMAVAALAGCKKNELAGENETTAEVKVVEDTTIEDEGTTEEVGKANFTIEWVGSRQAKPDPDKPAGMVGDETKDNWGWASPGRGPYGIGDAAERNQSGIQEFRYSFGLGNWLLKIDDQAVLEIHERAGFNTPYVDGSLELNDKEVSEFNEIYIKNKLWRWDGYDRSAAVTDASGFTLTIQYKDGKETKVHGYCVYPEGWADFDKDIDAWIEPLRTRIMNQTTEEDRIKEDDELIETIRDIVLKKISADPPREDTVKCTVNDGGTIYITGYRDPEQEYDFSDYSISDEICNQALGHPNLSILYLCPFHSETYTKGGSTVLEFTLHPTTGVWSADIYNRNPGSKFYREEQ